MFNYKNAFNEKLDKIRLNGMNPLNSLGNEPKFHKKHIATFTKAITPLCLTMCPKEEINERSTNKRIDFFERDFSSRNKPNESSAQIFSDPSIMVKAFRRSDAGRKITPEIVRPHTILLQTCYHLLINVLEYPPKDLLTKTCFVTDRLRAIRQDLVVLHETNNEIYVEIMEKSLKFHLIAMYCNCNQNLTGGYDSGLNGQYLNSIVCNLLSSYSENPGVFRNEDRFRALSILLQANTWDSKEFKGFSKAIRKSPKMQIAIRIYNTIHKGNTGRFFDLFRRECGFFECVCVHQFIPLMRFKLLKELYRNGPVGMKLFYQKGFFGSKNDLQNFVESIKGRIELINGKEMVILSENSNLPEEMRPKEKPNKFWPNQFRSVIIDRYFKEFNASELIFLGEKSNRRNDLEMFLKKGTPFGIKVERKSIFYLENNDPTLTDLNGENLKETAVEEKIKVIEKKSEIILKTNEETKKSFKSLNESFKMPKIDKINQKSFNFAKIAEIQQETPNKRQNPIRKRKIALNPSRKQKKKQLKTEPFIIPPKNNNFQQKTTGNQSKSSEEKTQKNEKKNQFQKKDINLLVEKIRKKIVKIIFKTVLKRNETERTKSFEEKLNFVICDLNDENGKRKNDFEESFIDGIIMKTMKKRINCEIETEKKNVFKLKVNSHFAVNWFNDNLFPFVIVLSKDQCDSYRNFDDEIWTKIKKMLSRKEIIKTLKRFTLLYGRKNEFLIMILHEIRRENNKHYGQTERVYRIRIDNKIEVKVKINLNVIITPKNRLISNLNRNSAVFVNCIETVLKHKNSIKRGEIYKEIPLNISFETREKMKSLIEETSLSGRMDSFPNYKKLEEIVLRVLCANVIGKVKFFEFSSGKDEISNKGWNLIDFFHSFFNVFGKEFNQNCGFEEFLNNVSDFFHDLEKKKLFNELFLSSMRRKCLNEITNKNIEKSDFSRYFNCPEANLNNYFDFLDLGEILQAEKDADESAEDLSNFVPIESFCRLYEETEESGGKSYKTYEIALQIIKLREESLSKEFRMTNLEDYHKKRIVIRVQCVNVFVNALIDLLRVIVT